jgi:hypothetical protein
VTTGRSRRSSLCALVVAALAVAACSSSGDGTPAAPAKGTVTLKFGITDFTKKDANLKSPLQGTVYGALFLAEDVGLAGPRKDAKQYAEIEVANVDIRNGDSVATWTSPPLEPNRYIFTGFFDVNGNGAQSKQPDSGDPATVPGKDKQFDIAPNKSIDFVEKFDIIVN